MLNLLNSAVGDYLKENPVLTAVLAIILAIIAVLCVIMIVLKVKQKKTEAAEKAALEAATEAPAEESAEQPAEEPAQESEAQEQPAEEKSEEPVVSEEKAPEESAESAEPVQKENAAAAAKPAKKEKVEPVVQLAAKKPAPAKKPAVKKIVKVEIKKEDERPAGFQDGKWIIRKTESGKFGFKLYASNGSVMLESGKEYSSLSTAKQGIETYKKNFADGNYTVTSPKSSSFVYKLSNANGMLLAVSSNYTSKSSCENALENTKTYALNAPVEVQ